MSNEKFPLYPRLTEEGENEAQLLMDKFKESFKKMADEALGELYSDVACYIESDSWLNFRNDLMSGFKNYENRKVQSEWDFREIRKEIYKEFRDEIIKDLDQDNLKEIESLKKQLKEANDRYFNSLKRSY